MKPLSLLIYHVFQVVSYWSFISFATEAAHFHSRQLNDTDTGEEFDMTTVFSSVTTIVATMIGALIAAVTSCTIFLCKRKHKKPRHFSYRVLENQKNQSLLADTTIKHDTTEVVNAMINEYAEKLKAKYINKQLSKKKSTYKLGYIELEVQSIDSRMDTADCETALDKILVPGIPVRCVLIEGESGVGKSTLVSQICFKWAREELKQYKLVVLVELREVQATCPKDIFQQYATHHMNNPSNMDSFLNAIGDGSGTLIILDGFDELPTTANKETLSFYKQLIQGMNMLSEATIIITSRPTVSAYLSELDIGRQLKIFGLTEKRIREYVELKFSTQERVKFMQYISNPIISKMIRLPLYTQFVARIFDSANSPQLKTIVELYDQFTRELIYLHVKRNGNSDFAIHEPLQNGLPSLIAEQFKLIVQMAYKGLKTEKQDFTAGLDIDKSFEHLGVMKKEESDDIGGPRCKFSYFHQTHQEYLAALHIVYTPALHIPPSFGKRDILRFLAGMCCDNDAVTKKVVNLLPHAGDQRSLQMVRCFYECKKLFPIIQKMLKNGPVSVCGKIPFDYYLIGHCICHVRGQWNITIHSKDEIHHLRDGLQALVPEEIKEKIQEEILLNVELRIQFGPALANIEQILYSILEITTNIHSLILNFIAFRQRDAEILEEIITKKRLIKIKIRNSCKNVDVLLSALFEPSSLDTVHFSGTLSPGCGKDSIEWTIKELFGKNETLKKLHTDDMIINPETLAQILSQGSLKKIEKLVFCVARTVSTSEDRFRKLTSSFRGELEPQSYQQTYFSDESTECESAQQDVPLNLKELIEAAQERKIKYKIGPSGSNTLHRVPKSCDRRSQTVHARKA